MRILGIDPGSLITGFGVIDVVQGKTSYVASGCVRIAPGTQPERLKIIFDGIVELSANYQPDEVAIERVFMHRNVASALKLGEARGAAICAAVLHALPVHEYTPAVVKQTVVGKGNAGKEQVQHMVRALLNLPAAPQADAADALAVALCHAYVRQALAHIPGARGIRRGRAR